MKNRLQIALISLALVGAAAAQEAKVYRDGDAWIEETSGSLPAQRNLKLITNLGSVHIQGGTASNISYTVKKRVYGSSEQEARRAFDLIHISTNTQGDTVTISGQGPKNYGRGRSYSADFDIRTPRELDVNARTSGGNLEVSSIAGRVEANTAAGNVSLNDIGGVITASSGGGGVDIGTAGSDVNVEIGGGNISLHSAKGNVSAISGGGTIAVSSCGGDLTVETGAGNISAGNVGGRVTLKTGGGSIKLTSAHGAVLAASGGGGVELYKLMGGAKAETGGGGITAEFIGHGANFTDSRLETAAGDIRVYLPGDLPVTVRAAIDMASGQKIYSEFPELQVSSEGPDFGPKETYCLGNLNGGGKVLHIHTSTGNIELLKRTIAMSDRRPR
jgi:hypothetical protein